MGDELKKEIAGERKYETALTPLSVSSVTFDFWKIMGKRQGHWAMDERGGLWVGGWVVERETRERVQAWEESNVCDWFSNSRLSCQ